MKRKEKKIDTEQESVILNDIEERETIIIEEPRAQEIKQPEIQEKEEKEKKPLINLNLEFLTMLLAIISISLTMFGKLFLVVNVVTAFQVFFWLGAIALISAMVVYIIDMFQTKKFNFTPSFVLLLLAIFVCAV